MNYIIIYILGWPKISFGFFCKMLRKNPDELFGQSNNYNVIFYYSILLILSFI